MESRFEISVEGELLNAGFWEKRADADGGRLPTVLFGKVESCSSIGDSTIGWGMSGEETERYLLAVLIAFNDERDCCDDVLFRPSFRAGLLSDLSNAVRESEEFER